MASRFVLVFKEKTLKINKEGTPLNTKKAKTLGFSLFDCIYSFSSLLFSYIFDGKLSART